MDSNFNYIAACEKKEHAELIVKALNYYEEGWVI